MKSATVEEAQQRLPELIAAVRAGESVEITQDGAPIASLVGTAASVDREPSVGPWLSPEDLATLRDLKARGLIDRWPHPDPDLLDRLAPGESGILQALLDERDEGW